MSGLHRRRGLLMGASGGPLSYDETVLADSPAGYWKLDEISGEDAVDSSGNGRDGSFIDDPALSSSGVTLDGISQCIKVISSDLDVIGDDSLSYTLEVFVTELTGTSSLGVIISKTNISSPAHWNLLQNVNSVGHFQLYDGSDNPVVVGGALTTGSERILHVVRNRDTNTIEIFMDGIFVQSASDIYNINTSNSVPLCFGARGDGTDRFNKCKLRRAAVYLTALDATQIAARQEARAR